MRVEARGTEATKKNLQRTKAQSGNFEGYWGCREGGEEDKGPLARARGKCHNPQCRNGPISLGSPPGLKRGIAFNEMKFLGERF